jgi:hypothetical protein
LFHHARMASRRSRITQNPDDGDVAPTRRSQRRERAGSVKLSAPLG